MRAYVITSGTVFALVVLAHLLRLGLEGVQVIRDPVFTLSTIVAAALAIWSLRVGRLKA